MTLDKLSYPAKTSSMTCRECGSDMYVDDRDYHRIKSDYDTYWNCRKCTCSCIQEIRNNIKRFEHWHSENDGVVKDEEIIFFCN